MADRSGIGWTDATWNPVVGCSRVSPGCDHCYAIRDGVRLQHLDAYAGTISDGDWTGTVRTLPERLDVPLRWRKPRRIFVNSMSDLFHPAVDDRYIEQVLHVVAYARRHTFQVLTKRPQRMATVLGHWQDRGWLFGPEAPGAGSTRPQMGGGFGYALPLANLWLGTSIEADRYAWRADYLRSTPVALRFLSLEPLLGPLPSLDLSGIDWVIVGGESGPQARPMHPSWVRDIRDRCIEAGVALFFKQWGAWVPVTELDGSQEHLARSGVRLVQDGDEQVPMVPTRGVGAVRDPRCIDHVSYEQYPVTRSVP